MIEIRELSVKVNVNPEPQNGAPHGNGTPTPRFDKKVLIDECLEQVSKMLENKKER
jgi:hypothetical protein